MVRASIAANNLGEYYAALVAAQKAAHGDHYCDHHTVIRALANEPGCERYAELGVNEGATLACALLAWFDQVTGIDIALEPFRPAEGLFRAWATAYGAELRVMEQDSREPLPRPVDVLLIDSRHEVAHLREELRVHGPNVRRFVLIHDTAKYPELAAEAEQWAAESNSTVLQRETRGYGWMLLQRQA